MPGVGTGLAEILPGATAVENPATAKLHALSAGHLGFIYSGVQESVSLKQKKHARMFSEGLGWTIWAVGNECFLPGLHPWFAVLPLSPYSPQIW